MADYWCVEWTEWDGYELSYHRQCFGGGGSPPVPLPDGSGGVPPGGGGSSPLPPSDVDVPQKLDCALGKYTHEQAKKDGKTIKRSNLWAFTKHNGSYWEYQYVASPTRPVTPSGYFPAGAQALIASNYIRMFRVAFEGVQNISRTGTSGPGGAEDNRLIGALSAFEVSLFSAAHDLAHLNGHGNAGPDSESNADWYGIYAVLQYRADGGAECAGLPDY